MKDDKWFFWLLTLVFLHLRLQGSIDWAWWVVVSPMWGWGVFFGFLDGVRAYRAAEKKRKSEAGP